MIVHKRESRREKSKIILPRKLSTRLVYKNKKTATKIKNMRKISMYSHKKSNISTVLASPKIKNIPINQDKVHSHGKYQFNKA